jgi:hypothetical protein
VTSDDKLDDGIDRAVLLVDERGVDDLGLQRERVAGRARGLDPDRAGLRVLAQDVIAVLASEAARAERAERDSLSSLDEQRMPEGERPLLADRGGAQIYVVAVRASLKW